jgi:hypothetical protein
VFFRVWFFRFRVWFWRTFCCGFLRFYFFSDFFSDFF